MNKLLFPALLFLSSCCEGPVVYCDVYYHTPTGFKDIRSESYCSDCPECDEVTSWRRGDSVLFQINGGTNASQRVEAIIDTIKCR